MCEQWLTLWPPGDGDARRMCVFAHYSADQQLHASVVHQLHYLSALCRVVFVTQSRLAPADHQLLQRYCTAVLPIPQDAKGRDLTSYAHGVQYIREQCNTAHLHWLWLVNDSFYGPFCSLSVWQHTVQRTEQSGVAAWGLTNSFTPTYHIQSYFVALNSTVVKDERFWQFLHRPWHRLHPIRDGELRLFSSAIAPKRTVAWRSARKHERFNPYTTDWRGTLARAFILKKDAWKRFTGQHPDMLQRISRAGVLPAQWQVLRGDMT